MRTFTNKKAVRGSRQQNKSYSMSEKTGSYTYSF